VSYTGLVVDVLSPEFYASTLIPAGSSLPVPSFGLETMPPGHSPGPSVGSRERFVVVPATGVRHAAPGAMLPPPPPSNPNKRKASSTNSVFPPGHNCSDPARLPVLAKLPARGDVPAALLPLLPPHLQSASAAASEAASEAASSAPALHSLVTLYGVVKAEPARDAGDAGDDAMADEEDAEMVAFRGLPVFHAVAYEKLPCLPSPAPGPGTPPLHQLRAAAASYFASLLSPHTPFAPALSRVLLNALLSSTPVHLVAPDAPPLLSFLSQHLLSPPLFPGLLSPPLPLPLRRLSSLPPRPLSPLVLPPGSLLLSPQTELHAELRGGVEYDFGL
jgi:hypothetical protein